MSEVQVPKVGPVNKKILFVVGGGAAAFIAWRWWSAGSAPVDEGEEYDEYADGGVLPSVAGSVRPDNSYGLSDDTPKGTDAYGFVGTTNAQWTQYAITHLMSSDRWTYTDIVTALGNYLNGKPLNTTQQSIVQAAIAVAGQPPVGTHPIIPGGDAKITVAPTGLKVVSTSANSVTLSWSKVAGADSYRIYRSGATTNVGATDGANSSIVITGLTPNTEYSFQVAADSSSGAPGPKSSSVKGKTKAVSLKAPTGLKVTSTTKTSVSLSWNGVPGSTEYRLYRKGTTNNVGASRDTKLTYNGLRSGTTYYWAVAATNGSTIGPRSAWVKGSTKKK